MGHELDRYEYKVHENVVPTILAVLMFVMTIIIVVMGIMSLGDGGEISQPDAYAICLFMFFIPGVLLVFDYKRRALYIIREGREYCYVPFIGKKRFFVREEICEVKIRPVKLSPRDLCLVAKDQYGKKIFGVELNMVNAHRLAAELIPDYNGFNATLG